AAVLLAIGGGAWWLLGSGDAPSAADPAPLGQTPADKPQQQTPVADAEQDGGERPLLMPGKKTLFQRVLTKPGAAISAEAGGPPRAGAVPAFSVLYVYARKQVGGSPWLRVGASSNGEGDGWLPASAVSDWKQSLVLKFTERSGRAPVMFLNSAEQVERLLGDTRAARDTLTQAVDHKGDPQVVAVEPNDRAIPQDQFYLLPIFDSKESFDADGQPAQLLEVASIDPGGSAAAPQAPGQAGQG
ncbi:serine/threonine protein kinase, partial [Pseudomonas aeruginosa]|nr:serine/threonine protein kinase [Pseudomonas aeruginosa]